MRRRIGGPVELSLHTLLRGLPVGLISGIGGVLGSISGAWFQRSQSALALSNLVKLLPDATPGDRRARMRAMWRNHGRVVTEFSCLARLRTPSRIQIVGAAALPPPGQAVVIAACHTANWEALSVAVMMDGRSVASIYQPQADATRNAIALRRRRTLGWIGMSAKGNPLREALRHLTAGGAFVIYIDELRDDLVMAPTLGRALLLDGNIKLAARMARLAATPLVFADCERVAGARFRVTFTPVPPSAGGIPGDVKTLDAMLETVVRARPEQWQMLRSLTF